MFDPAVALKGTAWFHRRGVFTDASGQSLTCRRPVYRFTAVSEKGLVLSAKRAFSWFRVSVVVHETDIDNDALLAAFATAVFAMRPYEKGGG
jgi:hypothetical protein